MLRGALLALMLVSASAGAWAQERAPGTSQASERTAGPTAPPRVERALEDTPPPSAYDRAREDLGQAPDTQSLVGQLLKTMFALGIVIAIIWVVFRFGAARLLPGAMGPRDGRIVRIIERVLVDQKNSLLVIDVGADRVLLGVTEGGINVLSKLGASQPVAPGDGKPSGFRAVLDAISPKKPSEDDNGGS